MLFSGRGLADICKAGPTDWNGTARWITGWHRHGKTVSLQSTKPVMRMATPVGNTRETNKLRLIEQVIQMQDPDVLQQLDEILNPPSEPAEWQKRIIAERLADYEANPGQGRQWPQVKAELQARLQEKRRQQDQAGQKQSA